VIEHSTDLAMAGAAGLRERKSVIDTVWLTTLVLVAIGLGVPWYLRVIEIRFSAVVWALFGYAALSVIGGQAAERLAGPRGLGAVVWSLQLLGFLTLTVVWHFAGGVANPLFLVFFVPPILACGLLARPWQPFALALFSIAAVTLTAITGSQDLRWYLARIGLPLDSADRWLPPSMEAPLPFHGWTAPPSYAFFSLVLFAIMLLAVAFVTVSLNVLLVRFYLRAGAFARARAASESPQSHVVQASPDPAVLVYSDSGQIVQASDSLVDALLLDPKTLAGSTFPEIVDFVHPELVRSCLEGGEVPYAAYRVGEERRIAHVVAWRLRHGTEELTYVTLRDVQASHFLRTAIDAVDEPYVLLGREGRLVYFNAAATSLFGELYAGIEPREALGRDAQPEGWWDLGLRRDHERRVRVGGRSYVASLSAARVPGERDRMTVVRLRSAGEEAS
jgi:PAS domain-containing protein